MKHIRTISVQKASMPFRDFFNSLSVAWSDFIIAKKNQLAG